MYNKYNTLEKTEVISNMLDSIIKSLEDIYVVDKSTNNILAKTDSQKTKLNNIIASFVNAKNNKQSVKHVPTKYSFNNITSSNIINTNERTTIPTQTTVILNEYIPDTKHDILPKSFVFCNNKLMWFSNYLKQDLAYGEFIIIDLTKLTFSCDGVKLTTDELLNYAIQTFTNTPINLDRYIELTNIDNSLTSIYTMPSEIIKLDDLQNAIVFNMELCSNIPENVIGSTVTFDNEQYKNIKTNINRIEYSTIPVSSKTNIITYKYITSYIPKPFDIEIDLLNLNSIVSSRPTIITPGNKQCKFVLKPNYSCYYQS